MADYTNSQTQALINEYIHSERDRQILTDRLISGHTYAALAERYGLSDRQISRIVTREAAKLFKHL